jgi:cytochrome c biogenesis protein CcdA
LPAENRNPENIATTVTEVSDRVTVLVREEIELAKAEMTQKVASMARGAAAVAVGAVFGVFTLMIGLGALAWGLNSLIGNLWSGFVIVFGLLLLLTLGAMWFAYSKLKVGAPMPNMAIDEAKKIRATVTTKSGAPD